MALAQRALETFADLPRGPDALKVIRRIKEKEISLAEGAQDFITSIRATRELASLRRRLSASLYAMTGPNSRSAQSDDLGMLG